MKKKDTKKNPQQLKQEKIHQKNLYLKRIKTMMGIVGSESAYDCLGPMGVEMLYLLRLRPVKFISPETTPSKMSKHDLTIVNDQLTKLLQTTFIRIGLENKQVSIYDFCSYIETLHLIWRNVCKENCLNPEAFKEKLTAFNEDYLQIRLGAIQLMEDRLDMLSWAYSDMTHHIFRVKLAPIKNSTSIFDTSVCFNNYIAIFDKPESELFEIDGHKRTIYRVVVYKQEQFVRLVLTPQDLGMSGMLQKLPLNVYIQSHAMERIKERLGVYFLGISYMEIFTSIMLHKTFPSDDGGFLFPYTFSKQRVGYLKAKVIGDKIVIRTFLFLTNNGTPEGKKLATILGVQKADKMYLGIDKLSTFINSDIETNENLKRIFCQAGCGGLFELKKLLKGMPDKTFKCADYLSHYLGLKEEAEVAELH